MSETTIDVTEETIDITEDKKYNLRKLNAGDVAPMCVILSNIGVDEFRGCFSKPEIMEMVASVEKGNTDTIASSVGFGIIMDIAGIIMKNFPKAEKEIHSFLASLSGMEQEQVKELDFDVFFEMIIDVIKKDEFKGFIKVVSKLFK